MPPTHTYSPLQSFLYPLYYTTARIIRALPRTKMLPRKSPYIDTHTRPISFQAEDLSNKDFYQSPRAREPVHTKILLFVARAPLAHKDASMCYIIAPIAHRQCMYSPIYVYERSSIDLRAFTRCEHILYLSFFLLGTRGDDPLSHAYMRG